MVCYETACCRGGAEVVHAVLYVHAVRPAAELPKRPSSASIPAFSLCVQQVCLESTLAADSHSQATLQTGEVSVSALLW